MTVRDLQRRLADSSDPKLVRVLQLVDGMERRGEADALIAPLRDRLRHLRPARRPRFGRLLFLPFDPVIVSPLGWRPELTVVPRSALPPFIALVRAAFGAIAEEVDAALLGGSEPAEAIGERLWPAAGRVLLQAARQPPPADWAEAGLPAQSFAPMAASIAGVLPRAALLRRIAAHRSASREEVMSFLGAAAEAGADQVGLATVLLLHAAPSARRFVGHVSGVPSAVIERAVEAVLDQTQAELEREDEAGPIDLDLSVAEARQAADLLESLQEGSGPRRQARIAALREDAAGVFRTRLEKELLEEIIEPAQSLSPAPDDAEVLALEQRSRTVRALDHEARRFGRPDQIDRVMRRSLEHLAASGLQGADLIRTVEILLGPEAALSLMRKAAL